MAGNDRTSLFFIKEKGCEVDGSGAYWLHALHRSRLYGQTCVRTLPYAYAVVNSTTRNWAHLTSKHPQSPQKMGEGDYGRIPKAFCPLFDFGEEGRPSHDFSYFSISFLPQVFGQQLFKVLRKMDGIHCNFHKFQEFTNNTKLIAYENFQDYSKRSSSSPAKVQMTSYFFFSLHFHCTCTKLLAT